MVCTVGRVSQPTSKAGRRDSTAECRALQNSPRAPQAWPPALEPPPAGSFAIHGIPADHGVHLGLRGLIELPGRGVTLNTGALGTRPETTATYRSTGQEFKPGRKPSCPSPRPRFSRGWWRFADTNEPARSTRLTASWASQEQLGAGPDLRPGKPTLKGVSNQSASGRAVLDHCLSARWRSLHGSTDTDITRKDGALSRRNRSTCRFCVAFWCVAAVVESGTNRAVAGAAIQYIPESFNNPNAKHDIVTGAGRNSEVQAKR